MQGKSKKEENTNMGEQINFMSSLMKEQEKVQNVMGVLDTEIPAGSTATSPFFQNLPSSNVQVPELPRSDQPVNPPEFQPPPPSGPAAVAAVIEKMEATPEKPKRGRKKKEDNTDGPTHEKIRAAALSVEVEQISHSGPFTLYIDCCPVSAGSYVHAATYYHQAIEDIKAKLPGALGWRLGEPVAYGKGAELLAIRVSEIAKERGQNVVLDSRTPEGSVCMSSLMALTDSVVMGFR